MATTAPTDTGAPRANAQEQSSLLDKITAEDAYIKPYMGVSGIERYFTIKEAAALLRRHPRTVWRWTVEGKIEYHQPYPGCKILIPDREINRLRPRDE